jgi:hypothetical protein
MFKKREGFGAGSGSVLRTNAQKHGDQDPVLDPQHCYRVNTAFFHVLIQKTT